MNQTDFIYLPCEQVTRKDHEFLNNIEEREEGGTPAIVGALRIGLVMQLKHVSDNGLVIVLCY